MARKQNKTIRLIIATLILLLVLVVLPLGSWYYLNNGLNYRLTTMGELKEFGKLSGLTYPTFAGKNVQDADLQGKVTVANVINLQDEQLSNTFGNVLEKLHDQFDERQDVLFLIHVTDTSKINMEVFATRYKLDDYAQCQFIPTDAAMLQHLQPNYYISADSLQTHFTLVDTKSMVRKHYDVRDEAQVKRLVEHIALLLPLRKKEEITLKRELEK